MGIRTVKGILLNVLIGLVSCKICGAGTIDVNANWKYTTDSEDANDITSTYNVNLNLDQDITEAISLNESLRYSMQVDEENEATQTATPNFSLSINNDIFLFDLSSSTTIDIDEEETDEETDEDNPINAQCSITSAWDKELWPELRLDYSVNDIDNSDDFDMGFTLDWDLDIFTIYYRYGFNTSSDEIESSESESIDHNARLEATQLFWDNRLTLSLSQQFTINDTESRSSIDESGFAYFGITTWTHTLSGHDDSPDKGSTSLHINNLLDDNDFDTDAAEIDPAKEDLNIVIKVNREQIDLFYVYTEKDVSNPAAFQWDVYYCDDDVDIDNNTEWTRLTSNASTSYNSSRQRFEVDVYRFYKTYLKVVAVDPPSETTITEVDAARQVTSEGQSSATEKSDRTESISDFSMDLAITPDLSIDCSITLQSMDSSDNDESSQRTISSSVRWMPLPDMETTLSISDSLSEAIDEPDKLNRSYTLNISSPILPTLDVSLGVTRGERYEDGVHTDTNHTFSVTSSALLYPDLNADLDMSVNLTDDIETGKSSSTRSAGLGFTARLTPKMTATLDFDATDDSESEEDRIPIDIGSSLNWRVSEFLSITAHGSYSWADDPLTKLTLGASLAPTEKVRMNFDVGYDQSEDETSQNYSMGCTWNINRHVSLDLDGDYRTTRMDGDEDDANTNNTNDTNEENEDSWSITADLTVRFSVL
ncbi:MAG: hypothetical protein U9O82_13430 [Thermodesulfobacteriota bacterium]|nr:hypothetical protein [Thermodesulfobacteriota bacterium]